jgi:hypothetical protein
MKPRMKVYELNSMLSPCGSLHAGAAAEDAADR